LWVTPIIDAHVTKSLGFLTVFELKRSSSQRGYPNVVRLKFLGFRQKKYALIQGVLHGIYGAYVVSPRGYVIYRC
jgi:hypothetical protein